MTSDMTVIAQAAACKDLIVNMWDCDGNAFAIIGRVAKTMRLASIDRRIVELFQEEAMAGNYEELLRTCDKWVTIVNIRPSDYRDGAGAAFRHAGIKITESL